MSPFSCPIGTVPFVFAQGFITMMDNLSGVAHGHSFSITVVIAVKFLVMLRSRASTTPLLHKTS